MTPLAPHLHTAFQRVFAHGPEWYVRAPGRVNLIGDHTDYNHLPVFPMAIQRSITIVGRSRSDSYVQVANVDPRFTEVAFDVSDKIPRGPVGSWENYVKAGPRMLAEEHGVDLGFDALVSSDLPVAAGLSSSSALVVACGLAVCHANAVSLPVHTMASLMARAERFVGTRGGGMDQAVCLGGRTGSAVEIRFAPLRLRLVDVPASWRFIIAHSLERAEKSGSAQAAYNRRTEDCRQGLARVSRLLTSSDAQSTSDYPGLLATYGAEQVLATAQSTLSGQMFARMRHTITEAIRVDRATEAMRRNDRVAFGELMVASHDSLRNDYDVSVPALDELVRVMLHAGCDGARLTGAGFGGCVVGLCDADRVTTLREDIVSQFYRPRRVTSGLDDLVFVAEPSDGARCMTLAKHA